MAQEKLDSSEFPFQTIQKRKLLSKKKGWPWASSLKWPKKSWIPLSFPSKPSKSEKSSQKKKRWPWASSLKWPKKSWIPLSFPSKPSKSEKSSQKKKMALGIFPKMAQEKLDSSEFPFQTIQKRKILSKKMMALGIFPKMAQEKLDSSEFPFQTIQKRKILSKKKRWPWASSLKWPKKSWIPLSFPSKPSKSEKSSPKKKDGPGHLP